MSLWGAVKNKLRIASKDAEDKLRDPEGEFRLAIEDSEKAIQEFQAKIVSSNASLKQLKTEEAGLKKKVKSYETMATKAIEADKEDDARKILEKQSEAETRLNTIKAQIKSTQGVVDSARQQVTVMRKRVSDAKANKANLSLREQQADLRKGLAEAQAGLASDDPLANLDAYEDKIEAMEAEASAVEEEAELSADGTDADLESKYGSEAVSSVDDKLAALKAKKK